MIGNFEKSVGQPRVPFMAGTLPDDFVPRSQEFAKLRRAVLRRSRKQLIAITGAGGYGKTTLAKAICDDRSVQQAFPDGILWVDLGGEPIDSTRKIEGLIARLNYGHSYAMPDEPKEVEADFARLLNECRILLVIDDVRTETDLQPFLQGGEHCVHLITTRNERVLPRARWVQIGAMSEEEAVQLLSTDLEKSIHSAEDWLALHLLATRLGKWPILLELVNRALLAKIRRHQLLPDALNAVNNTLDTQGLTGFDEGNPLAVAQTLKVSFDLLKPGEYDRYQELAIFPENVDIPLTTVQKLWGASSRLDDQAMENLCVYLSELSLLYCDLTKDKEHIRLHDVFRTYLQEKINTEELQDYHRRLLNSYKCQRWAELPRNEPYLWKHLAEHLIGAGRSEELVTTVKDGGYLATKTPLCNVYSIEADIDAAIKQAPADASLRLLKRNIARVSHLLNRCKSPEEVAGVLHSRLSRLPKLSSICHDLEKLTRPFLTSWYQFMDLSDPALMRTLKGHENRVRGCAVDPWGNFIVSASDDETLKFWRAETGGEQDTLKGHTKGVNGCAIDPREGKFIVSASSDKTLRVWKTESRAQLRILKGHTSGVYGCAISPDGKWIVSTSSDKTLRVWNAQGRIKRHIQTDHTDIVNGCAVSPDGKWIISTSSDGTLKVWDADTGMLQFTLADHASGVYSCAVSPDGKWIVSASDDNTLKVWDVYTRGEPRTLKGHTEGVYGCAVSPDGKRIVSASSDGTLKVWDAGTGSALYTLEGHNGKVYGCAVSPDGKWIVSASDDNTLKMWYMEIEEKRPTTILYKKGTVTTCAVSPSDDYIVSTSVTEISSFDGILTVWDAQQGTERPNLVGHIDRVSGCAVSPDGSWVVSGSGETLKVWDAYTGAILYTLEGHTSVVNGCAVSPDGKWIVSASYDNTLKVWDAYTGAILHTLEGHTNWVRGCAVSSSRYYIVSNSDDGTLKVWNARTWTELHTLNGHIGRVNSCAISPDGKWIVSASDDRTLKKWDAETGAELRTLNDHIDRVNSCAISPDGKWIASASDDETLKVWDAQTGKCLTTLLVDGALRTCAFYSDGIHLVAGGEGGVYFLRLIQ